MLAVFIAYPWAALLPAMGLGLLYRASRRPVVLTAAVMWLCYAVWETGMALRLLCSGECNIRVDLLLIYPVLLGVSLAAVAAAIRAGIER